MKSRTLILIFLFSAGAGGVTQWAIQRPVNIASQRSTQPTTTPKFTVPLGERPRKQQAIRPDLDTVLAAESWPLFRLLGRFLPAASIDEVKELAETWEYKVTEPAYPEIVWKLLLARWVELNPEGALACERQLDHWAIHGFCYETWLALDYESALAAALREAEPNYRHLLSEVAKRDPKLALQWVKESIPSEIDELMEIWCRQDLESAVAAAKSLDGHLKESALNAVILSIGTQDPDRAFTLAGSLDEPRSQRRAISGILSELINEDPEAAIRHVQMLPKGEMRSMLFGQYVRMKCQTDSEAAWTWAKSLTDANERHQAINLAMERLAGDDQERLFSLIEEVGWEYATRQGRRRVREPGGGRTSTGSDGRLSGPILDAIRKLAGSNPHDALAYLAEAPRLGSLHDFVSNTNADLLLHISKEWMKLSPEEALSRLTSMPDTTTFNASRLAMQLVNDVSDETLPKITEYLKENPNGTAADSWANWAVQRRAKSNPAGALEWFEQLDKAGAFDSSEDDRAARDAYGNVAKAWMRQDSMAASEWAVGLDPGPRRDAAVGYMVSALLEGDEPNWRAAFAWSQTVGEAQDRVQWLQNTLHSWHEKEPNAAREALDSSNLPDALKQNLHRFLRQ